MKLMTPNLQWTHRPPGVSNIMGNSSLVPTAQLAQIDERSSQRSSQGSIPRADGHPMEGGGRKGGGRNTPEAGRRRAAI
eukprot:7383556-Prymnesium_polylepis.1